MREQLVAYYLDFVNNYLTVAKFQVHHHIPQKDSTMQHTLIQEIAAVVTARLNCQKSGNTEWIDKWETRLDQLADLLPSGSGIDCGTKIDLDESTPDKIVLVTSYHHMNDGGYYDGWTEHKVTVRPDWRGVSLKLSGRDRNQIKDYLHDVYYTALRASVEWSKELERYTLANTAAV